jgi:hypothetical protein
LKEVLRHSSASRTNSLTAQALFFFRCAALKNIHVVMAMLIFFALLSTKITSA